MQQPKIIGLVPGAMKPYHAGHHYLTEQAMNDCDEVIIITTTKDRNIISGAKMAAAWVQLIIPLLSNVDVKFAISPIREVYNILKKENGDKTGNTIRIYGGVDEINRFNPEKIKAKYPNITPVNVAAEEADRYLRGVGPSPMAKGEWVRNAIQAGDFRKFREFLPEFLKPHAEEYLNILT